MIPDAPTEEQAKAELLACIPSLRVWDWHQTTNACNEIEISLSAAGASLAGLVQAQTDLLDALVGLALMVELTGSQNEKKHNKRSRGQGIPDGVPADPRRPVEEHLARHRRSRHLLY
jgi:hypothetical protein